MFGHEMVLFNFASAAKLLFTFEECVFQLLNKFALKILVEKDGTRLLGHDWFCAAHSQSASLRQSALHRHSLHIWP